MHVFILFSSGSQLFFLQRLPLRRHSWRHERTFPFLQKRLFTSAYSSLKTKNNFHREKYLIGVNMASWHLINYTSVLAWFQENNRIVRLWKQEFKNINSYSVNCKNTLYVQTVCKKKQIYADPYDCGCLTWRIDMFTSNWFVGPESSPQKHTKLPLSSLGSKWAGTFPRLIIWFCFLSTKYEGKGENNLK